MQSFSSLKVPTCSKAVLPLTSMIAGLWPLEHVHNLHVLTWRRNWTTSQIVSSYLVEVAHILICYECKYYAGGVDELVQHGLVALRECLPSDAELTSKVCWK